MKHLKGAALAQHIIRTNIYLTLGTSWGGKPWVSPVCYFTDAQGNFYYASQMKSVHTKNILKNPHVSWAVFDSHALEGTGVGVQIKGKAGLVRPQSYDVAMQNNNIPSILEVLQHSSYHLFKLTPQRIYVTDPDAKVDIRVRVAKTSLRG